MLITVAIVNVEKLSNFDVSHQLHTIKVFTYVAATH